MRHAVRSLCEADKRLRRHEKRERERVEGREGGIARKAKGQVCPSFRKSSQKKRVRVRRERGMSDNTVVG